MVHFYPEPSGASVTHLDLLSPMPFISEEGEAYRLAKESKLRECLDLVGDRLLWLEESIESVYLSTPRTYSRYTSSPLGSAFGVRRDWRRPLRTVLSPRTPLKNLLFTGQSLNLHGLLGVSMTSVLTCREILGKDFISLRRN